MQRITAIIIGFLILTSCTPSEERYKSKVPTLESRIGDCIGDRIENRIGQYDPQSDFQFDLPSEINLDVPFYPQAPDADWGMPWQEACEEAAVLLAYYYAIDQKPTKEEFKKDILILVDWQNENYGSYEHTDIDQTAKMLSEVFKFSGFQVLEYVNVENLKTELAQGHLIVAPFAGRQLGNPFYTQPGPLYHMMVLKGYDEKYFITNDVGTKRGENFIYPYDVIMSAMHEWHDTDIDLGAKKVIVLSPVS